MEFGGNEALGDMLIAEKILQSSCCLHEVALEKKDSCFSVLAPFLKSIYKFRL